MYMEAINELNEKIHENHYTGKISMKENLMFDYSTNEFSHSISIGDAVIWCSEADEIPSNKKELKDIILKNFKRYACSINDCFAQVTHKEND